MLEQCTANAIKKNNPDYHNENFGGVSSREIKVGGITLIIGKKGQCFFILPSFFLSYSPPTAEVSFEARFSVAKSCIVLATLMNNSGHLDGDKFLDLKCRMQCYLTEVRGLNGTLSNPKGDLQLAIHNALPKGLVTHKSTNILPISKKMFLFGHVFIFE